MQRWVSGDGCVRESGGASGFGGGSAGQQEESDQRDDGSDGLRCERGAWQSVMILSMMTAAQGGLGPLLPHVCVTRHPTAARKQDKSLLISSVVIKVRFLFLSSCFSLERK